MTVADIRAVVVTMRTARIADLFFLCPLSPKMLRTNNGRRLLRDLRALHKAQHCQRLHNRGQQ